MRGRCYFCDQPHDTHSPTCIVNNSESAEMYKQGFQQGISLAPILKSTHLAYLRGWCRGLRKAASLMTDEERRRKKKP